MDRSDSSGPGETAPPQLIFAPGPARVRHDGWTIERQRAFIAALAEGLHVGAAAARAGMSRKSAYALRARPGGETFAAAWAVAVAAASRRRCESRRPGEWERGVEGLLRPIRYRGRITAWDRRYDGAALLRLLRRTAHLVEP
jgi:hypothetical protein